MSAEQIADELIAARPYKAKPWKRRRLAHFAHARQLTAAEVEEFRSHVGKCINALSSAATAVPTEGSLCAGSDVGAAFCSEAE